NVAWMCAMPRLTFRLGLRFLLFAIKPSCRVRNGTYGTYGTYGTHKSHWSHKSHSPFAYRISFTPFFPATVFRGPLRVRAFVLVRWPRTGRPRRCRVPR